jgi:hypothetical protein
MASVFSEDLRIFNAENFKKAVSNQVGNTKMYFTFGKPYPWANDASPQQANTSVTSLNEVWDNMIGAKLITGNEVSHVTYRNDWTANTAYDAYDHCTCSLQLFNENVKFFIVTSDWNVYKCLSNNNGNISTVMPTQILTDRAVEEVDGYVWKYMYTISDAEKSRYVTNKYIPVKTLQSNDGSFQWLVQTAATSGAIEAIKVTNGGTNYSNASNIVITITGDGFGANAVARINTASNTVSNVAIVTKGSGYTFANVNITGGGGSNATFRAMISPTGGHGSDPIRELGASNLIINPRLQASENNKFPTTNDYRQISLIQDPFVRLTENVASNVTYSQYTTIYLDTGRDDVFSQDEIVWQGLTLANATFKGVVLSYDSANSILRVTNAQGLVKTEELKSSNGASRIPSGDIATIPGELQPYTGKLLYINNVTPIARAADQTEDFKIILKF